MIMKVKVKVPIIWIILPFIVCEFNQPEQVHLAFGENDYEIVATWTTFNETLSIVEYGYDAIHRSLGTCVKFTDGGSEHRVQYIHRATINNLTPGQKYMYRCGNNKTWSDFYWFTLPNRGITASPQIALFGDMGFENAVTLKYLEKDVQQGMYDAIFHVGDFGYDLNSDNGRIGDQFMNQIQPIAAYVPYMTCLGNHEEKYNFSHYKARFNMPSDNEGLYYSFNFGPVHFIFISTEVYYFLDYGFKQLVNQYNWLENDLKEATRPEIRKIRPWIIIMGHRPMYCSNDNDDNCVGNYTYTRNGLPIIGLGLETMLHTYSVDVAIWAHEHSYERFWPLYDFQMFNGSTQEPYSNAGAIVHLVTGSAGCKEGREKFQKLKPAYSAFRSNDYGFTRLKVFNSTHLYFDQVSVDKNGSIIDSFWLSKFTKF